MRKVFSALALSVAMVATALAQPYFANETGTILGTGPRGGANGNNFFNIEGSALGANSSYGVARWDLTTLKNNLNLAFGANNWRITSLDLVVTQSNAAFSANGDVRVFYTTDDTADIKTAASLLRYPFQNVDTTLDMPVVLADPLVNYTYTIGVTGDENLYNIYTDGDGGQRLATADDIRTDAGNKLTLVFEDVTTTVAATYRGQVGNATADPPELRVTAVPISGNPPTANAGADQTVTDTDLTNAESVTLDGSASHANPPATSITSYSWTEGGPPIASGVSPTVNFPLGVHTVQLTVTDNLGGTSSDTVTITVLSGVIIIANAGAQQTVTANACDGSANVTLNGSASTYNAGTITNYNWVDDATGTVYANGASATANVSLPVGSHTIKLTITGSGGETAIDHVTVNVRPAGVFAGHDFDTIFANFINIVPAAPFTSPADGFGVYQRGVSTSIPFGMLDDTASIFAGDTTGIMNERKLDAWFGSLDLLNPDNLTGLGTVEMTFDITGRSNIVVNIDMGAMGDFEVSAPSGDVPDHYVWTASIDGGTPVVIFDVVCDEAISNNYVLFNGNSFVVNDPLTLGGTTLTNILHTFSASIPGTGSSLLLKLDASTNGDDEAYVFDNVLLYPCSTQTGCPNPGATGNFCTADLNGDCQIDLGGDLAPLLSSFGSIPGDPNYNANADFTAPVGVGIEDLSVVLSQFGDNCN